MDGDTVELVIISHVSHSLICKITGVPGAAGVPAVIPVVDTSPGHGNVIGVTVLLINRVVLERVPRQKIVITPTKVITVVPMTMITVK